MRLIVVSHPAWLAEASLRAPETLVVAASVPALLELQRQGIKVVRTSDLLASADYQTAWEIGVASVWDLLSPSLENRDKGPNLLVIHAYSLFLLFAQILVMDRFFDRCREEFGITDVVIETTDPVDDSESLFFPGQLYTSYYHSVAEGWARANRLTLTQIDGQQVEQPQPESSQRRALAARVIESSAWLRKLAPRLAEKVRGATSTFATLATIRFGRRQLIAYATSRASGLHSASPTFALDISYVLTWLRHRRRRPRSTGLQVESGLPTLFDGSFTAADSRLNRYGSLVEARAARYLGRTYASGRAAYDDLRAWLDRMRGRGIRIGYVASAPFVDFDNHGYVAEAFRRASCPVAGIQHGGNARLYRRGGVPLLFTDFLGGMFFHWGAANVDEHEVVGVEFSCRFVETGSPRTRELKELISRRTVRRRRSRPRILYAPTIVSVLTSYGANVIWDDYVRVVNGVCEVLDSSNCECLVKILPTPEGRSFDWARYPNIRLLTKGGFVDYMRNADYLLIDSLGGSPIYEALATDKPILLYSGARHQEWDADFIEALRRRVIVFDSGDEYISGVREMVADPAKFVANSGTRIDDTLLSRYMPPVSPDTLWGTIRTAMFSSIDVVNR